MSQYCLLSESVKNYHRKRNLSQRVKLEMKIFMYSGTNETPFHFYIRLCLFCTNNITYKHSWNAKHFQLSSNWKNLLDGAYLKIIWSPKCLCKTINLRMCLNTILETGYNLQFSVTGKSLVEPCHLTPMFSLVGMERKVFMLPCHRRATEYVNTVQLHIKIKAIYRHCSYEKRSARWAFRSVSLIKTCYIKRALAFQMGGIMKMFFAAGFCSLSARCSLVL